jgi:hypothetical protein
MSATATNPRAKLWVRVSVKVLLGPAATLVSVWAGLPSPQVQMKEVMG